LSGPRPAHRARLDRLAQHREPPRNSSCATSAGTLPVLLALSACARHRRDNGLLAVATDDHAQALERVARQQARARPTAKARSAAMSQIRTPMIGVTGMIRYLAPSSTSIIGARST
jgi:hypothetical protein